MRRHVTDGTRPWWRRLLATLAPARPDLGKRLAQHHTAEVRLGRFLAQDAESLVRYSHQAVRVLEASEHARRRAQRLRRAREDLAHPVIEPITMSKRSGHTAWERLRANISELSRMSDAYLADANALERDHPELAGLLLQLHQDAAADGRDLVWTIAQLEATGVETSVEELAA